MAEVIAWVTPWESVCGISDYSKNLWPSVSEAARERGFVPELVSLDHFARVDSLVARLVELRPRVIHFQHEYGLYGGKNPPLYWFPKLIEAVRKSVPGARICATGHTVLSPDYRFPVSGRGLQIPVRLAANALLLRFLREYWGKKTWSLDGVIVHSEYQVEVVRVAGAEHARMIPHFVPDPFPKGADLHELPGLEAFLATSRKLIVVFGFFTPEKGQDIAIEALSRLPPNTALVLAGGVRRGKDQKYHLRCLDRVKELGLGERVFVTGFLDRKYVPALYEAADLVLVPFRETSGSGSVATAIAHGAPILASDLLLNRELEEREAGAFAFFKSGSAEDCARVAAELLSAKDRLQALSAGARRYGAQFGVKPIALEHVNYYASLMKAQAGYSTGYSKGYPEGYPT